MTADIAAARPRRKVLFLSFTYPSSAGTGTQLRSAALVRMLAAEADIHLLVAGYMESVSGPRDPGLEALCREIVYFRVPPGEATGGRWPRPKTEAPLLTLPTIDCPQGTIAGRIAAFYGERRLDSLFVFRFDALHFVCDRLADFPRRELDLDELPSRTQEEMGRLEPDAGAAGRDKAAQSAGRLMERMLLPRFHRVFVASAFEAEEVRRRTGFAGARVLPNIYPDRRPLEQSAAGGPREILFVGTLIYPPNLDAVLYFCREIFPLIRREKGVSVVFHIVGAGAPEGLDALKTKPGVKFMGYQEDLEPFYARAALVAVPLRAGTGTRLKILEAFALGRVVVSTSIGAQGLEVSDGENILLADDPEAFAQACIEVMDHPERAARICAEALRLHRERYSAGALLRRYSAITAGDEITLPGGAA